MTDIVPTSFSPSPVSVRSVSCEFGYPQAASARRGLLLEYLAYPAMVSAVEVVRLKVIAVVMAKVHVPGRRVTVWTSPQPGQM